MALNGDIRQLLTKAVKEERLLEALVMSKTKADVKEMRGVLEAREGEAEGSSSSGSDESSGHSMEMSSDEATSYMV